MKLKIFIATGFLFSWLCFIETVSSVKNVRSFVTNNEEFKITVVIDPGKDESYWELKTKAEEIFDNVAITENSVNVSLEMVNAARTGELVHGSQ